MDTQNDIFVHLVDLPESVKGRVIPNEDDTYTIVINSKISHDAQLRAYQHEIEHIKNGDFQKADVQQIESIAHSEPAPDHPDVKLPTIRRRRRKRRSRWAQAERQRKEKEALGITAWAEYEAHWLDPEYRF